MTRKRATSARHQAFARLIVAGMSQVDAYREIYPKSRRWTNQSVAEKAAKLAAKIRPSLEKMLARAETDAVMSREELLKLHTQAIRRRFAPLPRYVNVTPDGDVSINIDPDMIKDDPSIKRVKVRVDTNDARILEMEFHDYLPAAAEFADLQGFDAPQKHEIDAGGALQTLLSEIQSDKPRWIRRKSVKNNLPC